MKNFLYFSFLTFLILAACTEEKEPTRIATEKVVSHKKKEENKKEKMDSIPKIEFIKGYNYVAKILTTGQFHEDEVWKNAKNGKWYGIFENKSGFYLNETRLKIRKVKDQIGDEGNKKTAWEVKTNNADKSLILLQGLDFLENHKITQIKLEKQEMNPGEVLNFNFLGVDYKIIATADETPHEDYPEMIIITNYKLTIVSTKDGVERSEILVAKDRFSEAMIDIEFAGDIDDDGKLDLIINNSNHYNVSEPTLYLSKPAKDDQLLKLMGAHRTTGC